MALLITLVAVLFVGAALMGRGFLHQRTITVTAVGAASAIPSLVKIDIVANATGRTADLANANLSSTLNELNSTLFPFLDGNVSLIRTLYYEVYQPTNCTYVGGTYPYCVPTKLGYYAATEGIEVTIPDMENVPAAITGASGVPNLQIQDVQAQLSDSQQTVLGQEALAHALGNATAQAGILAGGAAHIRIENITVGYSQIVYPYALGGLSESSASKASNSSAFYSSRITVQKSVYVVFGMR